MEVLCPTQVYYPDAKVRNYVAKASNIAKRSNHRCRHGAVIWKGSRVSMGYNKIKNNSKFMDHSCSVHAEHDALRKHPKPRNAWCLSIRVDKLGQFAMAKPCEDCEKVLVDAGIKNIIYSDPSSESGFRYMRVV